MKFILLVLPLLFSVVAVAKTDGQITRQLLSQGYSLEHSTPANLLKVIQAGGSWGPMDPLLPYDTLEKFFPPSVETQNLIINTIFQSEDHIDRLYALDRLIKGFQTLRLIDSTLLPKFEYILQIPGIDDASVRDTALTLLKFNFRNRLAISKLKEISSVSKSPVLQVLSAMDLAKMDPDKSPHEVTWANQRLSIVIENPESASILAHYIGNGIFVKEVHVELVKKLLHGQLSTGDTKLVTDGLKQHNPTVYNALGCPTAIKDL